MADQTGFQAANGKCLAERGQGEIAVQTVADCRC
jgi:hypothetical protein